MYKIYKIIHLVGPYFFILFLKDDYLSATTSLKSTVDCRPVTYESVAVLALEISKYSDILIYPNIDIRIYRFYILIILLFYYCTFVVIAKFEWKFNICSIWVKVRTVSWPGHAINPNISNIISENIFDGCINKNKPVS